MGKLARPKNSQVYAQFEIFITGRVFQINLAENLDNRHRVQFIIIFCEDRVGALVGLVDSRTYAA